MDSEGYAMLVSLVVPFITGFLSKATWPSSIKFGIAVVLSLLIGFGTVVASGEPLDNWWRITILSIMAAKTSYWLFIQNTGLKTWLAKHGVK